MSETDPIPLADSSSKTSSIQILGWLILAGQLGIAILVSLLVAVAFEIDDVEIAAIFIGFLFVQMLLSAVAMSLAPFQLYTRLIVGTCVTFFFCICMYRCVYRDSGQGHGAAIPIVGAMLGQWIVFQIPLWIIRIQGWKLVPPGILANVSHRKEVQFGIRHLLIWTTVVAIFMGVTRLLVGNFEMEQQYGGLDMLEFGVHLTLGSSLIAVPIIWGCLSRFYFWFWILISIFVCTAVCMVQNQLQRKGDMDFVVVINITQATVAILVMLAVRMTGYRLNRAVPDSQAS